MQVDLVRNVPLVKSSALTMVELLRSLNLVPAIPTFMLLLRMLLAIVVDDVLCLFVELRRGGVILLVHHLVMLRNLRT